MSGVVLFGRKGTGSAVCEALLELTGQAYELKNMEKLPDGSNSPEMIALNPLGQVPALRTADGYLMTESAAIALWIADLAPQSGLAPKMSDPQRAQYLRLMLFMAANSYMTALRFYYPDRFSTDASHANAIKAKADEHMHREWAILSDMLGSNDYLLGTNMSAADLYLSMMISWEEDGAAFAARYPALAKLNARVWSHDKVARIWARHGYAL
ncbi:MAG: glutathione S-transferase family protein [Rhizobiaceae bacterium]